MGAPGRTGDATPNLVQTHVMAVSAAPDAMSSTPPDAALPPDDASEASDASVATVSSSNCDPQSPDEVPVIAAPDLAAVLAAQDVTDVLLADLNAPLVTISLEEKALAPVAPLLRVPYLERLLEAVRDGTPLDRLQHALRRRQAATGCGTKMKTVRSRSVSARPLKEPARGRVCITRQAGCNISHVSHLGEDCPAHSQWVSEASKGLQLTLQSSEVVSVKQRSVI